MLIIAGMGRLSYIHGRTTNYSMGFSVYVCYATVVLYYETILWLVTIRHKFLPKDKLLGTLSFIGISKVLRLWWKTGIIIQVIILKGQGPMLI